MKSRIYSIVSLTSARITNVLFPENNLTRNVSRLEFDFDDSAEHAADREHGRRS